MQRVTVICVRTIYNADLSRIAVFSRLRHTWVNKTTIKKYLIFSSCRLGIWEGCFLASVRFSCIHRSYLCTAMLICTKNYIVSVLWRLFCHIWYVCKKKHRNTATQYMMYYNYFFTYLFMQYLDCRVNANISHNKVHSRKWLIEVFCYCFVNMANNSPFAVPRPLVCKASLDTQTHSHTNTKAKRCVERRMGNFR